MYHPMYAWILFNWYKDGWWMANTSCVIENSIDISKIEGVLINSLVFDHSPRIEDEYKDKINQGNIVSMSVRTIMPY